MKYLKYLLFTVVAGGLVYMMVERLRANKAELDKKPEVVAIDAFSVKTAPVVKGRIEQSLSIMGTVFSDNDVEIFSETSGKVTQIMAEKGNYLTQGAVLAMVDDEVNRANLMTAEANLDKAKRDLERFESLFKQKATTETQVENTRLQVKNLEANLIIAKRQVANAKITVPINGILTERFINKGTMVAPGGRVGNIVDMSRLKVKVNVPEEDVFKLKVGDAVLLTSDVYPGTSFNGSVSYISPKGDDAHTYPVEAVIVNNGYAPLKAGMYGKVSFVTAPKGESLLIPRKALAGSIKEPQVYVAENGRAVIRKIVLGAVKDDQLEVISGLSDGEQVIVDGQVNLQEGSPIKISQ